MPVSSRRLVASRAAGGYAVRLNAQTIYYGYTRMGTAVSVWISRSAAQGVMRGTIQCTAHTKVARVFLGLAFSCNPCRVVSKWTGA